MSYKYTKFKENPCVGTDESTPFRENFIFANSVKIHSWEVKILRLEHALPTLINGSDLAVSQNFLNKILVYRKRSPQCD